MSAFSSVAKRTKIIIRILHTCVPCKRWLFIVINCDMICKHSSFCFACLPTCVPLGCEFLHIENKKEATRHYEVGDWIIDVVWYGQIFMQYVTHIRSHVQHKSGQEDASSETHETTKQLLSFGSFRLHIATEFVRGYRTQE